MVGIARFKREKRRKKRSSLSLSRIRRAEVTSPVRELLPTTLLSTESEMPLLTRTNTEEIEQLRRVKTSLTQMLNKMVQ